ncbi:retrotransposon protein, putative, ty1-copia subclass [Tanacetum coccineum]
MMNLTTLPKSFWGYALESTAHILNMVLTKKVYGTPYEIWHGKAPKLIPKGNDGLLLLLSTQEQNICYSRCWFFKNSLKLQEVSGSHGSLEVSRSDVGLELIQEDDTQPSKNTREIHDEVEPQNVGVPIRRSAKIPQAPDRYCFYVDAEEHELGDHNEPPNYKAALLDPKSDKWFDAMNVEMQSMKDNQVWYLLDLPPYGRTVRNIRAIRILLAIAAFYDYEIWQMDVKTTFLNGHLIKDVYMVQVEGVKQHTSLESRSYVIDLSGGLLLVSVLISKKILKKFRTENSKKGSIPMIEKPDYRKSQSAQTPKEVQRIQFQQNPGGIYWTAVKTTLKYLRNTKDMVLVYGANIEVELKVSCYADASFQTDKDDTKSQTGYVFVLNGGAVDWKSAKQSTTTMSSIEAEYIAAAEASMEAVWIRKFIDGLGNIMPSNKRPIEMLYDKKPALAIANDHGILKGAIHFQRIYHYIYKVIQEGEIFLKKVHTDDNIADRFTKPMSYNNLYEHARAIGICHASSLM